MDLFLRKRGIRTKHHNQVQLITSELQQFSIEFWFKLSFSLEFLQLKIGEI